MSLIPARDARSAMLCVSPQWRLGHDPLGDGNRRGGGANAQRHDAGDLYRHRQGCARIGERCRCTHSRLQLGVAAFLRES